MDLCWWPNLTQGNVLESVRLQVVSSNAPLGGLGSCACGISGTIGACIWLLCTDADSTALTKMDSGLE